MEQAERIAQLETHQGAQDELLHQQEAESMELATELAELYLHIDHAVSESDPGGSLDADVDDELPHFESLRVLVSTKENDPRQER